MRTTIEIDDELLRQAKSRAAATGETLRELVERGLRHELNELPPDGGTSVLRDARFGDPDTPGLPNRPNTDLP